MARVLMRWKEDKGPLYKLQPSEPLFIIKHLQLYVPPGIKN